MLSSQRWSTSHCVCLYIQNVTVQGDGDKLAAVVKRADKYCKSYFGSTLTCDQFSCAVWNGDNCGSCNNNQRWDKIANGSQSYIWTPLIAAPKWMQFRVVRIQFNFDGDQMRIRFYTWSDTYNKHLQGNDRNELECGVVLQCDSITETLPRVAIPSVGAGFTYSPFYTLHQMTLASFIRIPRVVKVTFQQINWYYIRVIVRLIVNSAPFVWTIKMWNLRQEYNIRVIVHLWLNSAITLKVDLGSSEDLYFKRSKCTLRVHVVLKVCTNRSTTAGELYYRLSVNNARCTYMLTDNNATW